MDDPFGRPEGELTTGARIELAAHLAALRRRPSRGLPTFRREVRRWLVDSGFATVDPDGTLRPTELAHEIGRAFVPDSEA